MHVAIMAVVRSGHLRALHDGHRLSESTLHEIPCMRTCGEATPGATVQADALHLT